MLTLIASMAYSTTLSLVADLYRGVFHTLKQPSFWRKGVDTSVYSENSAPIALDRFRNCPPYSERVKNMVEG